MQQLYRISEHYLGDDSKYTDSDSLTFVSKASTESGVLRSCKNQFSSVLKPGILYFFQYYNDGVFKYYTNAFYTGKSFVLYPHKV